VVKRLIIDDLREFVGEEEGDETVTARTVQEARFYLSQDVFDEVWWDYDMGGQSTTYQIAKDIIRGKQFINGDPLMVVHTGNVIGREDLCITLQAMFDVEEVFPY
jgi:hypothetical protein